MRSNILLLLLALLVVVRGDLFHYYKLRKFLTAVAFARALGKRPTILPVPIPIPIPIAQNEVVRIPAGSSKTFLTLTGSPKYSGGFSKGKGGVKFVGSSNFGYPLAGSFGGSSLGGSLGGSKIMVLDSNNIFDAAGGSNLASASNVVRVISGRPQGFFRKPQRYIISNGGSTTRNSENPDWVHQPIIQLKNQRLPIGGHKRPIPVGEKFRLP